MCGITAILGINVYERLLQSLKQLQNRGYDSAGICVYNESHFINHKFASTSNKNALKELETIYTDSTDLQSKKIQIGIAHTRWATHGAKTDDNSHPHMSMNGDFILVHNGIIENFQELKDMLIKNGFVFKSQTDTEVIVNLLEYTLNQIVNGTEYNKESTHIDNQKLEQIQKSTIILAIQKTIQRMEGTWGLAIMCKHTPNILYCTRHGSPLLISHTDEFTMITSEQSGFCNYSSNYICLQNHDICSIENVSAEINSKQLIEFISNEIYVPSKINIQDICLSPDPFPHWTIKEIHEQVESSLRAISMGGRLMGDNTIKLGGLNEYKSNLQKIDNIILLGCGTSYHAGMVGMDYLKELCDFNCVQLFDGAEFDEKDIPKFGKTAFILLSQSGETKDLHRCIEIGKKNNCFLIGVVNVPDSMIAREVHCGCYLNAGREVAVASTKAFTSQVILLSMIALWFVENKFEKQHQIKMINDLRKLYIDIKKTIQTTEDKLTQELLELFNYYSCFILGKGKGEAIAREGSLKIKEISYIHSEAYSSSSLKHGPFALLEPNFPVVLIDVNDKYHSKNKNAYEEMKSRHANVIVISMKRLNYVSKEWNIIIPENEHYCELLSTIVLQILAYKLSVIRGINPDMPKNLAKVVTVE